MTYSGAHWLLCLNLNREFVTPGRPRHAQSGIAAEPLPSEALFLVRHRSALAHIDLRARLNADRPATLYLAGFALAHEGLATLFDAVDLGLSVRVVADAVASPAIGDRSSGEIDRAALAIAASLSGVTNCREALNAESGVVVGFKGA